MWRFKRVISTFCLAKSVDLVYNPLSFGCAVCVYIQTLTDLPAKGVMEVGSRKCVATEWTAQCLIKDVKVRDGSVMWRFYKYETAQTNGGTYAKKDK